ncbi:hypothetical protein GOBAR_DD33234 [Gossypium barbadense]|nr:hypothetical protein GOBAR_DD33234 [Gossypium barbadense]
MYPDFSARVLDSVRLLNSRIIGMPYLSVRVVTLRMTLKLSYSVVFKRHHQTKTTLDATLGPVLVSGQSGSCRREVSETSGVAQECWSLRSVRKSRTKLHVRRIEFLAKRRTSSYTVL